VTVHEYHDGTKHHFHRFARSLGYLDWASQPNPFRSFAGAPAFRLPPDPRALPLSSPIGVVLRHALGLTAWKAAYTSRWSLRANPSSGNLHPTEAYAILPATDGLAPTPAVYHYAPDRHALEQRCAFSIALPAGTMLIALTSIHWREAWKYGERAFRYCQHDLGHAIASIGIAASLAGLRARLLPEWSHADIATLTGIDRDDDYVDAEREEAGCLIEVTSHPSSVDGLSQQSAVDRLSRQSAVDRQQLLAAVRRGEWTGRANHLSEDHVQWTFIDDVAAATRDPGRTVPARPALPAPPAFPVLPAVPAFPAHVIVQRRSALAFDGRSSMTADRFLSMLRTTMPHDGAPWDAVWWSPRIHFALFVHRVDGLDPGLYLWLREETSGRRLVAALGREFLLERDREGDPLVRLARGDARALAQRVSCDQAIAADGFFSLGMIADFDASLAEFGPSFYRHLFWESGVVGQVLYLDAEAAGARATGIGCFYDDPVHDALGLTGHAFQSLYHFTVGMPVEDPRLTSEPGYEWEVR